jgi:hypothetical protein
MKHLLILLLACGIGCKPAQVAPEKVTQNLGPDPYFTIDEQPVDRNEIGKYQPTDIASVTVYYGKDAKKNFGDKAKDGAVCVLTKAFATHKYETFFKSYSKEYEKIMKEYDKGDIQYILNERILNENFEGDLASINKKLIKGLTIIDPKILADKYQITGKKIGVLIASKRPKGLYNSKKKF